MWRILGIKATPAALCIIWVCIWQLLALLSARLQLTTLLTFLYHCIRSTDAHTWDKGKNGFEGDTADDWDIDMAVYYGGMRFAISCHTALGVLSKYEEQALSSVTPDPNLTLHFSEEGDRPARELQAMWKEGYTHEIGERGRKHDADAGTLHSTFEEYTKVQLLAFLVKTRSCIIRIISHHAIHPRRYLLCLLWYNTPPCDTAMRHSHETQP